MVLYGFQLIFLQAKDILMAFTRKPIGVFSLTSLSVIASLALLAPWLAPFSPLLKSGPPLASPSSSHIFGTDDLGRDIFSMAVYGLRTTLYVSLLATLLAALVGTGLGSLAGYHGGSGDIVVMRATEFATILPRLLIALILVLVFGPSIANIVLVIALTSWPEILVVVRSEFLSLKERQFVEAAKAMGESTRTIIFSEIFPSTLSAVIVVSCLQASLSAILEATIAFFGLGDPNVMSLGYMLKQAQLYLSIAPLMSIVPGVMLTIFVVSINSAADILAERLNPKLRYYTI
jgi:peptide/nickel transport system permease protein